MAGSVAPYSPAVTEAAARWVDHIADAYAAGDTVAESDASAREEIDKLERRGLICCATAALLTECFDLPIDA